jgi:hypothetical protein
MEYRRNQTLLPSLDLSQDCLQISRNRLWGLYCVLNFDGFQGYCLGKVRLAL